MDYIVKKDNIEKKTYIDGRRAEQCGLPLAGNVSEIKACTDGYM